MPDASAFTRQKKLNAIQQRNINNVKYLTHLYTYVPKTTGLIDFLPSYQTKSVQPLVPARKGTTPPGNNLIYIKPKRLL